MATSIALTWLSFSVPLDKINSYFRTTLSSNYDGIVCTPENMTVTFHADYSGPDSTAVNSYWSSITPATFQPTQQEIILQKIQAAQQFGQQLLQQIEVDNVYAGLTTPQVTQMLSDYSTLISMLSTGSLVTALAAAQQLQPVDGMTQTRINSYISQIETFLGTL